MLLYLRVSGVAARATEIYNIIGGAHTAPRCRLRSGMLESEEGAERSAGQAGRSQNLVYTLPHTTESIAEFLAPVLERIDPSAGGTQVVVVTRDAETALSISETVLRLSGAAGIEVLPVTSAARTGRILKARSVLAVAGTATELGALVRASQLKLDTVRTVILAWADDILEDGPESIAALEALLGELSEASRVIVARKVNPAVENLIERYARRARRVAVAEAEQVIVPEDFELPQIKYVTVAGSARLASLRRLLDDLDPPSATIVARTSEALADVRNVLRTLGYRDDDETINVTQSEFTTPSHAVIFYQPPVTSAELRRSAQARPVQVVVLAQPAEVAALRELASGRLVPLNLQGPERRARDREEAVRLELRTVLSRGVPPREIISLEPLLEEFDAAEVAAAALYLLERERAQRRMADAASASTPRAAARAPEGDRTSSASSASSGGMTRVFMTIGTRDGIKSGDLIAAISGDGGIAADKIGKIDMRESHSLVEIASGDAEAAIARVNGTLIKGRRVVARGERDREERERATAGRGDRPDRGSRPDRGGAPRGRPSGGRIDRGASDRGAQRRGGPPDRSSRSGPPSRNRDRS